MPKLAPIPYHILSNSAVLTVPTAIDVYQEVTAWQEYDIAHVHVQDENRTIKSRDNTEVTLTGILFIDERYSAPKLNYSELQKTAQEAGSQMTVVIIDRAGNANGPHTVQTVDGIPDGYGGIHHWELGLV